MKTKNKPVEITTAIVGGIVAAVHIVVAVYAIIGLADPNLWQLQGPGSSAMASIIVVFIEWLGKALSVLFAILIIGIALWVLILEILPLFIKSTKALRVIAIISSSMLAVLTFLEFILLIGNVVRGFRDGDAGNAMLTATYLLLAIGWFALNVTKAVIYKNKD